MPRLSLDERLALPDALLSKADLRDLGLGRHDVDRVFLALPVYLFDPSSTKAYVRVGDFLEHVDRAKYDQSRVRVTSRGERVRRG